jgi:hypothetical protein
MHIANRRKYRHADTLTDAAKRYGDATLRAVTTIPIPYDFYHDER